MNQVTINGVTITATGNITIRNGRVTVNGQDVTPGDAKQITIEVKGAVYPVVEWERLGTGERGWAYCSKSSGGETHEVLNEDCRVMFEFSLCWRGVWEGRLYFKDDEYWGEEMRAMSHLWDVIEALLKARIRKARPEITE